jgi:glucan phosphoethanolaminetransferase (alkaline phosphatase superfamily)
MIWIEFCAVLVIWLSLWSLIPRDEWWFRGADFPRLQILAIGIIALLGLLFMQTEWTLTREYCFWGLSQRSHSIKNGFALYANMA